MDIKPADGSRVHFRKVLTSTITKLVGEGTRQAVVFVNESASGIYLGHSGTVTTLGLYIPTLTSLADNYSRDEYWGYVSSGSGTVSGFIIQ